ncbi:hypothetical protein TNCV_947141 [Trichonephila clavipes]|nr:hypothetical protein TNCV_947141 [Trichonephila clavipes]
MVLKAMDNDRRKSLTFAAINFVGLDLAFADRQFVLVVIISVEDFVCMQSAPILNASGDAFKIARSQSRVIVGRVDQRLQRYRCSRNIYLLVWESLFLREGGHPKMSWQSTSRSRSTNG